MVSSAIEMIVVLAEFVVRFTNDLQHIGWDELLCKFATRTVCEIHEKYSARLTGAVALPAFGLPVLNPFVRVESKSLHQQRHSVRLTDSIAFFSHNASLACSFWRQ